MKTRRSVHGGRRSRRRGQRRRQRRRTLRGGGIFGMFKSKEQKKSDEAMKQSFPAGAASGQANLDKLHAHDAEVKAAGGHDELEKQKVEAKRKKYYGKHGAKNVVVDWSVKDVEAGVKPEAVRTATSPSILGQTGKDEYGEGRTAPAPARRIEP